MKFVVSDLDGTLLHSHSVISEYTVKTVDKLIKNNINFAIATGRGQQGVQDILKQLGIKPYLICNNGANIYTPDGKCIFDKRIPKDTVTKILKEIRKNNLFYSAFQNEFYFHSKDEPVEDFTSRPYFTEIAVDNEEDIPDSNKIIVTNSDPQVLIKLVNTLKEKFSNEAEIMLSQPTCLDVAPKGCSKGTGIENLAKIFSLTTDDFMAFGDGENDIEMLKTVGHPVIMENSQEILKELFSNTTLSNKEDGVAVYLTNFFNLQGEANEK